MNIVLTKHPERQFTMGLSMSIGTGPAPSPTVRLWSTNSAWTETFDDGKIPDKYYSGRTDLIKVQVDGGITYLGDRAFCDCVNLSACTVNGTNSWKGHVFMGCTSLKDVSIGEQYTTIEGWAFSGCTSLEEVVIPDNIAFLGGYSFQNCTSLHEVTLSSALTTVGINMFYGCTSLDTIVCRATTAPTLGNNVFRNVAESGNLYIPSGATGYDVWLAALPEGWWIYEVQDNWNFGVDVQDKTLGYHFSNGKIPDGFFSGRSDIGSVFMAEIENQDITEIGESAFEGCSLFDFHGEYPETLETIDDYAFRDCVDLTNVYLPSTMESIGAGAFSGCSNLTEIGCDAEIAPTLGTGCFDGLPEEGNLVVPEGADYSSWYAVLPVGWGLLADYVEVPAGMDWSTYFDYGGDLISESGASVEAVYFTLDSMVINVYDNNFIDAGSLGQYDIINNNGNCEWVLHSTGEAPEPESQEEEDMMTLNENFETSIIESGGAVYVRYKCTSGNVESVRFGGNGSSEGYYVNNNVLEDIQQ